MEQKGVFQEFGVSSGIFQLCLRDIARPSVGFVVFTSAGTY
jgi:hypothetical protein